MKKILIYSVLCLIAALPVSAQKFYKDAINITNASLWRQGESLYINMQMDMRNLKVSNDRTLTLTPVLTGPDNNVVLPEIVINGRRRQKAYLRAMALDKATNMEIPYNTQEVLNYTQVIPYEPWMENARLDVQRDECGCGEIKSMNVERLVDKVTLERVLLPYVVTPHFAYLQPKAEEIKQRDIQAECFLDFEVNRINIRPEYMNNQEDD